jgi:hypothetical protein
MSFSSSSSLQTQLKVPPGWKPSNCPKKIKVVLLYCSFFATAFKSLCQWESLVDSPRAAVSFEGNLESSYFQKNI